MIERQNTNTETNHLNTPGTVFWLTGLSGAGKTTIGRAVYERLKSQMPNAVFLDGDVLREVFGHDHGHTLEDRRKSAMRNARLCHMLSKQGIHVVCATISMFDDCRAFNRKHIANYLEVYLEVPLSILKERDQKQLYSRAAKGEVKNVIGLDLKAEYPKSPDLTIRNIGDQTPEDIANQIMGLYATNATRVDATSEQ